MFSNTISSIEEKVEILIALCQKYKEEKELLEEENLTLKNINKEQKVKIAELIEKQQVLKLARSFSGPNEKTLDTKQKISDFVREIDKCIALLNA